MQICTYRTVHISTRYRYQKSVLAKFAFENGLATVLSATSSEDRVVLSFTVLYMQFQHFEQDYFFKHGHASTQLSQNKGSVTSES
jgi:hypothetical protein